MSGKHFIDKKPESILDWVAIVCAGIAFYLLLNNLGYFLGGFGALMGILSPFFGGIVIAYILDPMVRFFHTKLLKYSKRWRWVAILLAYLVAVLLIVLLAWLVIPQIVNSIMTLFNNVPQYINGIQEMLLFVQGRYGVDLDRAIKMLDDSEAMLNEVYSLGKTALPQIMSTMGNVAGNFVNVFTAIASSIYLLLGKEKLLHSVRLCLRAALPSRTVGQLGAVFQLADRTFSGYIGGQLVDALLVGAETFALMLLLRLDYAPLIAVMVGATNIVPVLGPFLGAVPGVLLLLLESPLQAAEFLIIILAVQQIDGNFIAPRILGGATGLSGLGVLLAIVVGGELFGIPGMVAGVPTLAVLAALARQAVGAGLTARGLPEEPPPAPQGKTVTKKAKN